MTSVVSLVQYMKDKAVKTFHLFCDRCENRFTKALPLATPLDSVVCPTCKTDGFCMGQNAAKRKR